MAISGDLEYLVISSAAVAPAAYSSAIMRDTTGLNNVVGSTGGGCPVVPLSSPPASCPVLSTPPRLGAPAPSAGGTLLLGGTDIPEPSPPVPWSDFVAYVSPASILLASASRIAVSSAASCSFAVICPLGF